MRLIVCLALMLLASQGISYAQEWRGIKPLRSTCEDVKRALGVDKCEYPRSIYRLKEETVTIGFVMCPCPLVCSHQSGGWNVPAGTVGGITRQLHKPTPVADFNVDSDKWKAMETDFIGQVIYTNYEEGVTVSSIEGNVDTVSYFPPLYKYKHLLCPDCSVPPPPNADKEVGLSSWIHGYDELAFDEEKKHLDKFATKLKEHAPDSKGYIVAYGGCRTPKGEALARAERAKEYLVNTHGIESNRIITLDGGQHKTMDVQLHIRKRGLPPPLTFSSTYPSKADQ